MSEPVQRQSDNEASAALSIAVGLIVRDGRILVARRPEGAHLGGLWEFPGGKAREGETPLDALRRELAEEVGIVVGEATLFHCERHEYPERSVALEFFRVTEFTGEPTAREGQPLAWVPLAELPTLAMPAANETVVRRLVGSGPPETGKSCLRDLPSRSPGATICDMTGLDALSSVQFITVKGKRLAVLSVEDWEALIEWLETSEDLQIAKEQLAKLRDAGGDRDKAGWLKWDDVRDELE